MNEFSPSFEARLRGEEHNPRPAARQRPGAEERSVMAKAATKRRKAQEDARARTTECQMPMCTNKPIRFEGKSLGICLRCGFDIIDYVKAVDEIPALTKHQMNRRMKQQTQNDKDDQDAESRTLAPGWIYYILINGRIKIGYSTDVKARFKAYPFDAELLAMHPGTKTLEREMHQQFRGSLTAGREWFLDTTELRDHIKQVIFDFGEPDRLRYENRSKSRSN